MRDAVHLVKDAIVIYRIYETILFSGVPSQGSTRGIWKVLSMVFYLSN